LTISSGNLIHVTRKADTTRLGRPRGNAAVSHAAIMDAVYQLLETTPAREVTMDAVARQAGVAKPTLYKWWPSKSALIVAAFHERFSSTVNFPKSISAEDALKQRMRRLIQQCNGLFGKAVADLIAEGQADPAILNDFFNRHVRIRRESTNADIQRGIASGEFRADTDSELLMDMIFSPVYLRLLLRQTKLTEKYGLQVLEQAMLTVRNSKLPKKGKAGASSSRSKAVAAQ